MANQRGEGQKQVLTFFEEEFLVEIAKAMKKAGYSDRSKFIRDAVYEKLQAVGIRCDYALAMAPVRTKITNRIKGNNNTVSFSSANAGEGRTRRQGPDEEPPASVPKNKKKKK